MPPTAVAVPKKRPIVVRSRLSDSELQEAIDFSVALKMRNFAELLSARLNLESLSDEPLANLFSVRGNGKIFRRHFLQRDYFVHTNPSLQ